MFCIDACFAPFPGLISFISKMILNCVQYSPQHASVW